jgi:hypothetical protein
MMRPDGAAPPQPLKANNIEALHKSEAQGDSQTKGKWRMMGKSGDEPASNLTAANPSANLTCK